MFKHYQHNRKTDTMLTKSEQLQNALMYLNLFVASGKEYPEAEYLALTLNAGVNQTDLMRAYDNQ